MTNEGIEADQFHSARLKSAVMSVLEYRSLLRNSIRSPSIRQRTSSMLAQCKGMSGTGTFRTSRDVRSSVAIGSRTDIAPATHFGSD